MKVKVNLSAYAPDEITFSPQIRTIMDAEEPVLLNEWRALEGVLSNAFIKSLDINGILRWEKIMRIVPLSSDTVEQRRVRVEMRYNERPPYTKRKLYQLLSLLCDGGDNFLLDIFYNDYLVFIAIDFSKRHVLYGVYEMLRRILPANMVVDLDLKIGDFDLYSWMAIKHVVYDSFDMRAPEEYLRLLELNSYAGWALYSVVYDCFDMTDAGHVVSVNGKSGEHVTLTTTDVPEGLNMYYTNERSKMSFDENMKAKSVFDLSDSEDLVFILDRLVVCDGEVE